MIADEGVSFPMVVFKLAEAALFHLSVCFPKNTKKVCV